MIDVIDILFGIMILFAILIIITLPFNKDDL